MSELKAGDIVRVKSGGPAMTVAEVKDGKAHVIWFDGGRQDESEFPVALLEPIRPVVSVADRYGRHVLVSADPVEIPDANGRSGSERVVLHLMAEIRERFRDLGSAEIGVKAEAVRQVLAG